MAVRKGEQTKERILCKAQEIILQKGYNATSIDEVLAAADITKGGFFYHFKNKTDMARALLERYLAQDDEFFSSLWMRADNLVDDELQRVLAFLKLLADELRDLKSSHPGCIVASYAYENEQFDQSIRKLSREGMLSWRTMMEERLKKVAESHPPKTKISISAQANLFISIFEGAVIMAKVLGDPAILIEQLLAYRELIRESY